MPPNLPLILAALRARAQGNPFPLQFGHGSAAGPPPSMGAPAQGAGPSVPPGGPASGGDGGARRALGYIKSMVADGAQYLQNEPDAEDRATVSKCLAILHGVLAKDQKETDAATGVTPGAKVMRRQSQSQSQPGY